MILNYPKTILQQIDEEIAKSKRNPDSVTLDRSERHDLYRTGTERFFKHRSVRTPALRGYLALLGGRGSVAILAAEDL